MPWARVEGRKSVACGPVALALERIGDCAPEEERLAHIELASEPPLLEHALPASLGG